MTQELVLGIAALALVLVGMAGTVFFWVWRSGKSIGTITAKLDGIESALHSYAKTNDDRLTRAEDETAKAHGRVDTHLEGHPD